MEIPKDVRPLLGRALIEQFQKRGLRLLWVAVAKFHSHALVELLDDVCEIKRIVGQCKGAASFAIHDVLPGAIWSAGASYQPVDDKGHQHNTFRYILYDQGPGAWTWSYQDGSMDGMFDRKKPGPKGPA